MPCQINIGRMNDIVTMRCTRDEDEDAPGLDFTVILAPLEAFQLG